MQLLVLILPLREREVSEIATGIESQSGLYKTSPEADRCVPQTVIVDLLLLNANVQSLYRKHGSRILRAYDYYRTRK